MNTSTRKSTRHQRRGTLSVEVAVCLPLLLLTLFGCYEMAHANMLLHATESAAYEGARVGIIPGATEDRINAACGRLLRSVGIRNFDVIVTPAVITTDTDEVTVEVRVPFGGNTSIPTFYIDNPTFRGRCQLSRETL